MVKNKWSKYFLMLLILSLTYIAQLNITSEFEIDPSKNLIKKAYVLNASFVIVFFLFIDIFKEKYKDQIGFVFMASSLLKFIAFFIIIYPTYNQDRIISKDEIITFFVPYTLCLIYESVVVSKILNNLKF
jgi:hypothetical protein